MIATIVPLYFPYPTIGRASLVPDSNNAAEAVEMIVPKIKPTNIMVIFFIFTPYASASSFVKVALNFVMKLSKN